MAEKLNPRRKEATLKYAGLLAALLLLGAVAATPVSSPIGEPRNIQLSGALEGIDLRWDPPEIGEVVNYRVAYQALERQRDDSWAFMYSQGKTAHLIRHLVGGHEYRVFVQTLTASEGGPWASAGTVWTKMPSSVVFTPVPTATPTPTSTPTPTASPTSQPCTPETGTITRLLYPFADLGPGINVWLPIVFKNPDQQEWAYTFQSTWRYGSSHVKVTIDQDGHWTFTIQFGWNDPIITTGGLDDFNGAAGARNRFAFYIPASGLASGGGWYYGQFEMHVNDEQIPVEVPERILEKLRGKSRDVYVTTTTSVEYEYYRVTYSECRQWWHYW